MITYVKILIDYLCNHHRWHLIFFFLQWSQLRVQVLAIFIETLHRLLFCIHSSWLFCFLVTQKYYYKIFCTLYTKTKLLRSLIYSHNLRWSTRFIFSFLLILVSCFTRYNEFCIMLNKLFKSSFFFSFIAFSGQKSALNIQYKISMN